MAKQLTHTHVTEELRHHRERVAKTQRTQGHSTQTISTLQLDIQFYLSITHYEINFVNLSLVDFVDLFLSWLIKSKMVLCMH